VIFLINSYLDSGMKTNTEFDDFKIISKKNKLIIESKNGKLEELKEQIEEHMDKQNDKFKKYKMNITDNKLEIISMEEKN
jgi:hypothetical protein